MSLKRQLDTAVDTNAKRQYLGSFLDPEYTGSYACSSTTIGPESWQHGYGNEIGWTMVQGQQCVMPDNIGSTEYPPRACENTYDGWENDCMDISSPSNELTANQQICFGALCQAQAKLMYTLSDDIVQERTNSPETQASRFYVFNIILRDGAYGFVIPDKNSFAMIDRITSDKLKSLQQNDAIYKAVIEVETLDQLSLKKKAKKPFEISVNVYGQESDAHDIGTKLSEVKAFLQHPFYLEDGIEYLNPQFFSFGHDPKYLTHLVGMSESEIQAKCLSDEVQSILASLDPEMLPILPDELEKILQSDLTTPLKSNGHQKTALLFIRQHEDSDYCHKVNMELQFYTHISSANVIPSMAMGGVLADVMGLGKTLTMIAAIASSHQAATEFQRSNDLDSDHFNHHRTSATLVVVTSSQIMEVWRKEVSRHFREGSLRVVTFYGQSRPSLPIAMMDQDIVLTTFATLVADLKRDKVLFNVEWFRVILDEAHWIRNQSSKQFKAAGLLVTERRWCLSGTPVQNRIDDLVSLLRFLKFEPFSHMATFQTHILEPLKQETTERANPLRMLLRAVCLRRTETYLNLPEAHYENVRLSLSSDEQALYDDTIQGYRQQIEDIVSVRTKTKKYALLFTMVMKLRRICNHGTLHVRVRDLQTPGTLINTDIESTCEYCSGPEEDTMANLNGDSICPECSRSLSEPPSRSLKSRSQSMQPSILEDRSASVDAGEWDNRSLITFPGQSTKLSAVANNICPHSKRYSNFIVSDNRIINVNEVSLVFSCWRATLDILEKLLEQKHMVVRRIDGNSSHKERSRALEEFEKDPTVSVLLLTIQTGAVGLTLTAATQVHIVEPQWNPSVEEQAIARALRMGQTKTVTVFRYMMRGTVEENILTLQKKKGRLAKFTMDSNSGDTSSGSLEDLKFILKFDAV